MDNKLVLLNSGALLLLTVLVTVGCAGGGEAEQEPAVEGEVEPMQTPPVVVVDPETGPGQPPERKPLEWPGYRSERKKKLPASFDSLKDIVVTCKKEGIDSKAATRVTLEDRSVTITDTGEAIQWTLDGTPIGPDSSMPEGKLPEEFFGPGDITAELTDGSVVNHCDSATIQ
jgi:hypothetical protein